MASESAIGIDAAEVFPYASMFVYTFSGSIPRRFDVASMILMLGATARIEASMWGEPVDRSSVVRLLGTEQALGEPLLVKSQGGSAGGGSTLTPYAHTLMERYLALSRIVDTQADDLFQSGFLNPQ